MSRRKNKGRREREKWTPFVEITGFYGEDELDGAPGRQSRVYLNSRYHVFANFLSDRYLALVGMMFGDLKGKDVLHLSFKRIDRSHLAHDWRDMQRIKNELVGPECEAIELFPAESRLVDTSNQYHLFVVTDPEFRFPFGFLTRCVTEDAHLVPGSEKARQRRYEPDVRPADLLTTEALLARMKTHGFDSLSEVEEAMRDRS